MSTKTFFAITLSSAFAGAINIGIILTYLVLLAGTQQVQIQNITLWLLGVSTIMIGTTDS